jgi:hypothetical protein
MGTSREAEITKQVQQIWSNNKNTSRNRYIDSNIKILLIMSKKKEIEYMVYKKFGHPHFKIYNQNLTTYRICG